jgi:hypothetical protein
MALSRDTEPPLHERTKPFDEIKKIESGIDGGGPT